jgi:putative transposase
MWCGDAGADRLSLWSAGAYWGRQRPEFISKELDLWAWVHGVQPDFSRPGKSTESVFAESCNGRFREECLNACWFLRLADARLKCEAWRREVRPHSAIGNQTPIPRAIASGQACLT